MARIEAPFCDRCGREVLTELPEAHPVCGSCLSTEPPYRKARYAVRYEGELRRALIAFKYYNALHIGNLLAQVLVQAYETHFQDREIDCIVPVPLHVTRLYSRGYNQSVILGERLGAAIGLPLDRTSLTKDEDRPPQVGLTRTQRIQNVRGSFKVTRPHAIRGRRILLLDDVATTGATVTEAARTVTRAGADEVNVLVLAFRDYAPAGDDPADPQERQG